MTVNVLFLFQWTTIGDPVISSISASDLDPSDIGYLSYSISQENPFAVSMVHGTHKYWHTRTQVEI